MNDIAKLIKRAALEAMLESKPTSIVFGTVTSVEPLKITVEQKLTLSIAQLILTNNVRDYEVEMTVEHRTEKYKIHNALDIGDEVILLQIQGGQRYIVLEKVIGA
ncbi:DUF2577 domain-containing protein [Paenibacillus lentus]|uniref:DUF2577 domain-containing protein n=1 Tax=Paenibacillus lentus TaxID=1338368 RepID=A0A3Q8S761_9BACL|nr:DUF2577 domain-containing protein [Paenibacillus lentus]AZK48787.1 DUF2577 domain-containing protein [Paenibacillus lentus]